ncbi:MAG: hydroxymethylbilane synthase [Planctomycetales bacterium]|nr:hydroxymethylbilane synthase [Planctomycetales bacterium]
MADVVEVRLGTRGSPLALWQADWVTAELEALGVRVQRVLIETTGDVRTGPIGQLAAQGVFTKEIQRALLDRQIDLAVHSLKDLPTEVVPGLALAAVPARAALGDVLISRDGVKFADLPQAAIVGTGSLRRRSQLLAARPDLQLQDVRGNVDTRLRKLQEGQFDALVLAEAGLRRLGLAEHIVEIFDKRVMLPAVGQGALGLETRVDDQVLRELLQQLNHPATRAAVDAERSLLAALRGGCLAPVGAWGRLDDEQQLVLDAVVLSLDGRQVLRGTAVGNAADAVTIGRSVAEKLLEQGAAELIAQIRSGQDR